jgi:TRAP-type C4-dicarboxylate transport system substrate-binding protein
MKKINAVFAAAAAAAAVLSAGAVGAKTINMKIGMVTINDSNHNTSNWMKKEIEAKTNGRIKVGVFPAAQLGKIPRQIEAIQLGTQEVFMIPPGFFIGIDKRFMVTDAPGMFTDEKHATRAVNQPEFFNTFSQMGANKGFVLMSMWGCGGTSIATLKPFKKLADLKGRKIRVLATPLERAVIGSLGATGVPIPYSEVLPSLQRKTIDGVRSSIGVMHPSKFWTVAKSITLTGMAQITCGSFTSTAWLNKLPSDLKKIVMDVAKASTKHAGKWGHDLTRAAEKNWASEKGTAVYRLSDAEQAELIKRVRPIGDKILGQDPKTKDIYALLKKVAAATR